MSDLDVFEAGIVSEKAGPYLIVAAFWCPVDITGSVSYALRAASFPRAEGRKGAVVSFGDDVASEWSFQMVMRRLDLAEVNDR